MSDKRNPVYFEVSATAALKLNLDPDLYNSATLTKIGGTATEPADTVKVIPINIKYAVASGIVKKFKAKVTKGTGDTQKSRTIDLLVHSSKADTISTDKPATLLLGQGTAQPWDVVSVV